VLCMRSPDLDPAHVARVCAEIVCARQSHRPLRCAHLPTLARQNDPYVIDRGSSIPVFDVKRPTPRVAGAWVFGRDRSAPTHCRGRCSHALAAHWHLKLFVGVGWRDGTVRTWDTVTESANVPLVGSNVSLTSVSTRTIAMSARRRILATILNPQAIVLEHDIVNMVDADPDSKR
jgi:hypothetical protein